MLYVYGTVLPWLTDRRRDPLCGGMAFEAALTEQATDWRRIRAEDPDAILCVAGDLNQDLLPSGHYYGSARRRSALRVALAQAGLRCFTGDNADPVPRFGGGRASIDHIMVSDVPLFVGADGQLTVWPEPEQIGARLSDHFGVAVDLAGL